MRMRCIVALEITQIRDYIWYSLFATSFPPLLSCRDTRRHVLSDGFLYIYLGYEERICEWVVVVCTKLHRAGRVMTGGELLEIRSRSAGWDSESRPMCTICTTSVLAPGGFGLFFFCHSRW